MSGSVLLSTAFLPPVEYFATLTGFGNAYIEREENYLKQSFRNRCYILSANGIQMLTVPVLLGSLHKKPVKDIRIDYSKRWQQIHLRALTSSYNSSPYFLYYFDLIEKPIKNNYEFLLDLNMDLLRVIIKIMKIEIDISFTTEFIPAGEIQNDFRYNIHPKKPSSYQPGKYIQVFNLEKGFVPGLSIIDLLFNAGPEAVKYL